MILLKRMFLDQRGDIHLFTVFMTLFFFMFISIAATWIGVGANVMHIRNTVKNEMAAIAIRIEQDTYQALREGNLAAYEAKLNSSSAYHDQILHLAKTGIEKNIKLNNDNFVSRAPEHVVADIREKAQKAKDLIASLEQSEEAMKKIG